MDRRAFIKLFALSPALLLLKGEKPTFQPNTAQKEIMSVPGWSKKHRYTRMTPEEYKRLVLGGWNNHTNSPNMTASEILERRGEIYGRPPIAKTQPEIRFVGCVDCGWTEEQCATGPCMDFEDWRAAFYRKYPKSTTLMDELFQRQGWKERRKCLI